jgi:hypothetical protein
MALRKTATRTQQTQGTKRTPFLLSGKKPEKSDEQRHQRLACAFDGDQTGRKQKRPRMREKRRKWGDMLAGLTWVPRCFKNKTLGKPRVYLQSGTKTKRWVGFDQM